MSDDKKCYPCVFHCDDLPKFSQHYSDVVRDDDFKRVLEDMRNGDLSQDMGSAGNLFYDYQDGVVPDDDPVTSLIILLRSGKLDRADVQKIQDELKSVADNEHSKYTAEQRALAERALAEQRQSYLDEQTGFSSKK